MKRSEVLQVWELAQVQEQNFCCGSEKEEAMKTEGVKRKPARQEGQFDSAAAPLTVIRLAPKVARAAKRRGP